MGKMKDCFSRLEGAGGILYATNGFTQFVAKFTNGYYCMFSLSKYSPTIEALHYFEDNNRRTYLRAVSYYGISNIFHYTGPYNSAKYTSKLGVARRIYNKINSVS